MAQCSHHLRTSGLPKAFAGPFVAFFMVLWIYGFMVSWCYSFMVLGFYGFIIIVLQFHGFMVLWLQKIPISHFVFSGRYCSHIQDVQDFLRRIFGICGARLFETCLNLWSRKAEIYKSIFFRTLPGIFLIFFGCPGVSKDKTSWFWEPGTRP